MIHQISLMMIVRKRPLAEKLVFLCEYKSRLAIGGPFASRSVIGPELESPSENSTHARIIHHNIWSIFRSSTQISMHAYLYS